MGKITLSLSERAEKKLRKIAKKNIRSVSKQVEFFIEQNKNKLE